MVSVDRQTKTTGIFPVLKTNSELDRGMRDVSAAADKTDNMLFDLDRQIEAFHQKM